MLNVLRQGLIGQYAKWVVEVGADQVGGGGRVDDPMY